MTNNSNHKHSLKFVFNFLPRDVTQTSCSIPQLEETTWKWSNRLRTSVLLSTSQVAVSQRSSGE